MSALAQELRALAESFWRAGDYRTAASYHEHALKIESHAVADFDLIDSADFNEPAVVISAVAGG